MSVAGGLYVGPCVQSSALAAWRLLVDEDGRDDLTATLKGTVSTRTSRASYHTTVMNHDATLTTH
jgi:hypothetical protein